MFVMRRVHVGWALALALCGLSFGAPASARPGAGCPAQPVAQVFKPWSDPGWYASLPDGGMEARQGAWRLEGAAAFVNDNEPYYVRSAGDAWALQLGPGASAVSSPACIGLGHPTLRLFARSSGAATSTLRVSIDFVDLAGVRRSADIAWLTGGAAWGPTSPVLIVANTLSLVNAQYVSFRFTATGATWRLDDAYVDPYGKG